MNLGFFSLLAWRAPPALTLTTLTFAAFGKSTLYSGSGYLGGDAPDVPSDPQSPDGRARINGALAVVNIRILDAVSMTPVAETTSAADGTWRVENLSTAHRYAAIGSDPALAVNGAIQTQLIPVPMP